MPARYIVKDYLQCDRCNLCKFRRNIVFGRGSIPAKILFIGEAPGVSEDLQGVPFIGPSGKLLVEAMNRASSLAHAPVPSFFITNIVACLPTDSAGGKNREPYGWEAIKCSDRLARTVADVRARRTILLGKIAQTYARKLIPDAISLPHPAWLLRIGGLNTITFTGFVRDLAEVFKEVSK